MLSFRPEKTHAELACAGPCVVFVFGVVPVGGPLTSPANATPAAAPTTSAATEAATTSSRLMLNPPVQSTTPARRLVVGFKLLAPGSVFKRVEGRAGRCGGATF